MDNSSQTALPPVKLGDIVTLRVQDLAAGGDFVARLGPFAVFVSGGAPGDVAKVEITEVAKNFARGRVVEVEQPSPARVATTCPHADHCGGCDLQHIAYPAQLEQKQNLVRESLQRIGGITKVDMPAPLGMEDPWHYRNKVEYFVGRDEEGKLFLGFLRRGSHEVVPAENCAVLHPLNEQVREVVNELANSHTQGAEEKNALVKVISRVSFADEKAVVTFVTLGRPEFVVTLASALMGQLPQVSGVCHARARTQFAPHHSPAELVAGKPYLFERLRGFSFRISPDSFFQVNPKQAEKMLQVVDKFAAITQEEIVIDGYCGVGTFLIPLASKARMATGIEESKSAIDDANASLRKVRLENTRIYEGKVEQVLPRFAERKWHAGAVVLDPPRRGCGKAVITAAAKLEPRVLVLVSCDPATLARDLQFAQAAGYTPKTVQVIDMFPHTWHTEAIALCLPR